MSADDEYMDDCAWLAKALDEERRRAEALEVERDEARATLAELERQFDIQREAWNDTCRERDEARARITEIEADYDKSRRELWEQAKADKARIAELEAALRKYQEALIWCSGSPDFAPEGQAREGWLKLCAPLLRALDAAEEKP